MSKVEYQVVSHLGEWSVFVHQKHHGPYASKEAAVKDAIEVAHSCGLMGMKSAVTVQEQDGSLRTCWTFGQDPLPPKADD